MKRTRKLAGSAGVLVAVAVAASALIVTSVSSAAPGRPRFWSAVVSDVGRFNDKGFNQLSLLGCKQGAKAGGVEIARSSHAQPPTTSPTSRSREGGHDISIATGFLLADGTATIAKKFPKSHFAIVDYSVHAPPFANKAGKPLFKNVVGLTFATNENSYMIGCLAALMAKRAGGEDDQRGRRDQDPDRHDLHRRLRSRAPRSACPGMKTLSDYSQDFVDQAKCKELALNQIDAGSQSRLRRSPAAAASAHSTPPRRRRSGASASTRTRRTSGSTSSRAPSSAWTRRVKRSSRPATASSRRRRTSTSTSEQRRRRRQDQPQGAAGATSRR